MSPRAWVVPPRHPGLSSNEVHVWRIPLDVGGWRDLLAQSGLSEEETLRARRFRFDADRRRFVVRHAALRAILAAYLGSRPNELAILAGPHGKPFLDPAPHGTSLRFNLSSSGDLALLAVAQSREVGVDIEFCRAVRGLEALVARHFSPGERRALSGWPPEARLRAFFRCWTLKEAYLKACGDGLTRDLADVEVATGVDGPARLVNASDRPGDEARWTLRSLTPGHNWLAALAVEGPCDRVLVWDWIARSQSRFWRRGLGSSTGAGAPSIVT